VEQALRERYRARSEDDPARIEIDFPKRHPHRAAKERVARELDQIDPKWHRVFVLYPTESSLRERGE
jgi:hypothetical protein